MGHRNLSSRLKGVSWDKRGNKWKARSKAHEKDVNIGSYDIKEDAVRAYQNYVEHGTLPARKVPTSAFKGVSWKKKDCKSGQRTHLGSFQMQQEAALAYNAAVSRMGYPASWLDDVSHARSADGDGHNNKDAPAGKKAVVAARANETTVPSSANRHTRKWSSHEKPDCPRITRPAPHPGRTLRRLPLRPLPQSRCTWMPSTSGHPVEKTHSRRGGMMPAANPGVAALEEAAMEAQIQAMD